MPRRSPCVFGCEQFDVLHRFPKPGDRFSESDRMQQWKDIVGKPLEGKTDDDIYTNYRICNHHFENRFLYHASKRLAKTAYPSLNLDAPVNIQDSYEINIQIDNKYIQSVTSGVPSMVESIQEESSKSQSWNQIINNAPVFSHGSNARNFLIERVYIPSAPSNAPSVVNSVQEECSRTKNRNQIITSKPVERKHDESNIIKKLSHKIVILKNKLKEQRKQVVLANKLSRKKLFANVLKDLPVPAQILLNMQLKQSNKKSRGRRFNAEEISISVSLFEKSPEGYKLLRNMLALPSIRTLQDVLKKNTTKPA